MNPSRDRRHAYTREFWQTNGRSYHNDLSCRLPRALHDKIVAVEHDSAMIVVTWTDWTTTRIPASLWLGDEFLARVALEAP